MDPSYTNPSSPAPSPAPIVSSGDIVLPPSVPKKSKKPLVIILIILGLTIIISFVLWLVLRSNQDARSKASDAFLNFSNQLDQGSQDISYLESQYNLYYQNIISDQKTSEEKDIVSDYNDVWDFYSLYQKSEKITRVSIAQKYLTDGKTKTIDYFNKILSFFNTDNYYSDRYYNVNTEFIDITMRYLESYDNMGCLETFISQGYCEKFNESAVLISDEEYQSITTLLLQSNGIIETNYSDLLSGRSDIFKILGLEYE